MAKRKTRQHARPAKKARAKRTAKNARSRAAAKPTMPGPKQQFLDAFGREHQTTLKVIHALPSDQGHFQPHPRSQNAKTLIWTFSVEQALVQNALKGTLKMPPSFPPVPDSLAEVISSFERSAAETIAMVRRVPETQLFATSPFFAGPGKVADVPNVELMWMMLSDQIHHRGQLSVYVRMAGGKVPSIYGPSADEPWM